MKTYILNIPEDEGKKYERFFYPAGEEQVRLLNSEIPSVELAEKIVVIARLANGSGFKGAGSVIDLMTLSLLTDSLFHINGEAEAILVLPYLPYSRADRRFVSGDCHGLKQFGTFIDNLSYNHVVTFDVHSQKAHRYIANLKNVDP